MASDGSLIALLITAVEFLAVGLFIWWDKQHTSSNPSS